ncbi:hypothetical protein [Paraclostridium bifermentans]|uniref:hypothetical protein n=1 Tax=Paraclostridium bifermentans TaxID=1490 RepID=UPI00242AAF12|nr:hypothetical protein [Paraclostridium bifermentans]
MYSLIFIMLANLFFNLGTSLFVAYFNTIDNGSIYYSIILISISLGGIVSSIIFSKYNLNSNKRFKLFFICTILSSISLSISMLLNIYIMCICFFIVGCLTNIIGIIYITAEYNIIKEDKIGTVLSISDSITMILTIIAPFLVALTAQFYNIRYIRICLLCRYRKRAWN